jgi:hypothetical protein
MLPGNASGGLPAEIVHLIAPVRRGRRMPQPHAGCGAPIFRRSRDTGVKAPLTLRYVVAAAVVYRPP